MNAYVNITRKGGIKSKFIYIEPFKLKAIQSDLQVINEKAENIQPNNLPISRQILFYWSSDSMLPKC